MTRDEHLLTIAMEECVEVAQRLSKALRFGLEEVQATASHGVTTGAADESLTNRARIELEFIDLIAVLEMAGFEPCWSSPARDAAIAAKKAKVERFLKFSAERGRLNA